MDGWTDGSGQPTCQPMWAGRLCPASCSTSTLCLRNGPLHSTLDPRPSTLPRSGPPPADCLLPTAPPLAPPPSPLVPPRGCAQFDIGRAEFDIVNPRTKCGWMLDTGWMDGWMSGWLDGWIGAADVPTHVGGASLPRVLLHLNPVPSQRASSLDPRPSSLVPPAKRAASCRLPTAPLRHSSLVIRHSGEAARLAVPSLRRRRQEVKPIPSPSLSSIRECQAEAQTCRPPGSAARAAQVDN